MLPPGFELPFHLTCDYLEMRWGGTFHGRFRKSGILHSDIEDAARKFGNRIFKKSVTYYPKANNMAAMGARL